MDNGLESNADNWNDVSKILTHCANLQEIIESKMFAIKKGINITAYKNYKKIE